MAILNTIVDVIPLDEEEDRGRGLASADPKTRSRVARLGGRALANKHKNDNFYQMIGRRGGKARRKSLDTNAITRPF